MSTRVIDSDPVSVIEAQAAGIEAVCDNALNVKPQGDEGVVCFNLILHHLVGDSEKKTRQLQQQALMVWKKVGVRIFVNEYIYHCLTICFL